jgi:hypothetical protein
MVGFKLTLYLGRMMPQKDDRCGGTVATDVSILGGSIDNKVGGLNMFKSVSGNLT